jgi:cytochrome c-type biogenesis protein CcmF
MGYDIPGQILILLALTFNIVSGIAYWMAARGRESFESLAKRAYLSLTLTTTLAVAYLFYLLFTHNFAIRYVHDYSSRSLEFFYVMSAFWGGQEGTYLLWLFFSVLLGFYIIKYGGPYRNYAMAVFSSVNLFLLAIMVKLSPFALLGYPVTDGAGLNPLLQDPWMVIHPPVMFVGYAMVGVPFAIVMGALLKGDYSSWLQRAFPWVAAAALFLAAGNILGGYWAYITLGWGGFWAWDPVENSSFIPWMASLALVHGFLIQRNSGALQRTNMLLTAFLFIFVIYGTFLTRSGVLADFSVHSFVDLGTNVYLIVSLVFFLVMSLALILWRAASIPTRPLNYNLWSNEFMLFSAAVIIFLMAVVVLFWTSLPVITTYLTDDPRAANASTYNSMALPLALLMALLLTMVPRAGGQYQLQNWRVKLAAVAGGSCVLGLGLFWWGLGTGLDFAITFAVFATGLGMFLTKPGMVSKLAPALAAGVVTIVAGVLLGVSSYLYLLFFAAAAMAIVSQTVVIATMLPGGWRLIGGRLSHFGFGLMLIGILASSAFSTSEKLLLPLDGSDTAFGMEVTYRGLAGDIMEPRNELILDITENGQTTELRPQLYYSPRLNGLMRRPRIISSLTHDLYFAPEQVETPDEPEGLQLVKGDTVRVEQGLLRFDGFETSSHNGEGGGMRVVSRLILETEVGVDTLRPATEINVGADGQNTSMDLPAYLDEYETQSVKLLSILADQGAVVLDWPSQGSDGSDERLALTISKKPLIALVWAGTVLIIFGSGLTYWRRRAELRP